MFFKKKNDHTIHVLTLNSAGGCAVDSKSAAAVSAAGALGLATSGVHEEIERQVKRRLANEKFNAEYNAAPNFRIRESYDVKTHKDTFYLEAKQQMYRGGWSSAGGEADYQLVYTPIFQSEKKADVVVRFNRVMPKKTARKKAA